LRDRGIGREISAGGAGKSVTAPRKKIGGSATDLRITRIGSELKADPRPTEEALKVNGISIR